MNDIDLGRAFKAPFEDPEWLNKTMLGLLWGLLIVTSPALYGVMLDYIRGVAGSDERLPSWDGFGDKWARGFMVALAGFLYFLPVIVVGAVVFVPSIIAAIAEGDPDAVAAMFLGTGCCFTVAAMIYGVAISIFFYAAMVNYAMKNTFGAFFEFGEIVARIRSGSGFWMAWLYALVVSMAASAAISALSATGIGYILAPGVSYLMLMATGHLFGQWARREYARV